MKIHASADMVPGVGAAETTSHVMIGLGGGGGAVLPLLMAPLKPRAVP